MYKKVATFLISILEVHGSNLGWGIIYPDRVLRFSSVPLG
jgi:hypothetical protein